VCGLQWVAVCYCALQCLQCVAVRGSVCLQCNEDFTAREGAGVRVVVFCYALQYVAVCVAMCVAMCAGDEEFTT